MLNIDLDMRVDDGEEISMSLDEADDLRIGANEVYLVGDHATLAHRDSTDQHPISAITGLTEALANSGKIEEIQKNGVALPIVNKAVNIPISELPSASGEADGTALIAVNGEWTKQEGYGYKTTETGELANLTVTTTAFSPELIQDAFEPIDNTEYTVTYDGTDYDLTAFSGDVQG